MPLTGRRDHWNQFGVSLNGLEGSKAIVTVMNGMMVCRKRKWGFRSFIFYFICAFWNLMDDVTEGLSCSSDTVYGWSRYYFLNQELTHERWGRGGVSRGRWLPGSRSSGENSPSVPNALLLSTSDCLCTARINVCIRSRASCSQTGADHRRSNTLPVTTVLPCSRAVAMETGDTPGTYRRVKRCFFLCCCFSLSQRRHSSVLIIDAVSCNK